VEVVLGGEADAGEHLLAVLRGNARAATRAGLRHRRGDRVRSSQAASRTATAVSIATSVSASRCGRLELRDRLVELDALERGSRAIARARREAPRARAQRASCAS